jgi:hypothetical protein
VQPDAGSAAIAERLRQYLRDHPAAQDTESGVAQWWLAGADAIPPGALRKALRTLQEEGLLRVVTKLDGTVRFARSRTG